MIRRWRKRLAFLGGFSPHSPVGIDSGFAYRRRRRHCLLDASSPNRRHH